MSTHGAAVSHTTAAALYRFPDSRRGGVLLTIPAAGNARNRLAVVHRSDGVPTRQVQRITVVTPEQTLFDIAGRVDHQRLERALDHGLLERLVRLERLADRLAVLGSSHRADTAAMRLLICERASDAHVPPSSELERLLRTLLDHPHIPPVVYEAAFP